MWNEVGQATRMTLWGGNVINDYTYDGLGRLRTVSGTHEVENYTYDPAGNRLTSSGGTWSRYLRS